MDISVILVHFYEILLYKTFTNMKYVDIHLNFKILVLLIGNIYRRIKLNIFEKDVAKSHQNKLNFVCSYLVLLTEKMIKYQMHKSEKTIFIQSIKKVE